jgi:AcrR family transcriptional regulator
MGRIAGVTAAETRERLLDAAARVFELKGYEGATVSLIAKEAGVTTGAIYAHYSGKAELLVDALRANRERAMAALFPAGHRADATTLLVALGNRLTARRSVRDEEASALLVEALLASRRDAELAQVLATALGERHQAMTDLLARAQGTGELTGEISAEAGSRFTLMLGLGALLVRALDLPAIDQAEWSSFIRRLVGAFENLSEETNS